jgi:hypothetical protein
MAFLTRMSAALTASQSLLMRVLAGFIHSLRAAIGLEHEYEKLLERARRQGFKNPRQIESILGMVQPRLFSASENRKMLGHMKMMFDNGYVAVHPTAFPELVSSLRAAYSDDGDTLDKQHSTENDIFEALMISLYWWRLKSNR